MKLRFQFIIFLFLFTNAVSAQQTELAKKYPALLWEISGNGLQKKSYLFGTMHVSSKLAFHLSDSFYNALRSVESVALELNPEIWQPEMVRLNKLSDNLRKFQAAAGGDFFTEDRFKIKDYAEQLKIALSTEPPVVNSLLYRSYQQSQDFEEDTFLDLYIYQTARKLGKQPAGVENYYESEKLVFEAYSDMGKEKHRKEVDYAGETQSSLLEKLQSAYRKGDLDLMDSINKVMETSVAFNEKFLYVRNEIQAKSIDTIIKKRSLFVGVGAAHLPGDRGVIELLRKMGYTLRPIKMTDRDATQKAQLETLTVPVVFRKQQSEDGAYSVNVPGTLYSLDNQMQGLNAWQFADMNNGSYYMVSRINTYANFIGESKEQILKKIDSLLYENVPGKILSTKAIQKNGYSGIQIDNRTRTGNLQKSQLFITPFEIIIFKMSGREDYAAGKEATEFFNSIELNTDNNYADKMLNGIAINIDGNKHFTTNTSINPRTELEIKAKDASYLLFKTEVNNFDFISSDSFDINLMHESFVRSDAVKENVSKKWGEVNGYTALFTVDELKKNGYLNSLFFIKGADYYCFSLRTDDKSNNPFLFTRQLETKGFKYDPVKLYKDSFMYFSVATPTIPVFDKGIRELIEQSIDDLNNGNNSTDNINYWHSKRNAVFTDPSSGQVVAVSIQDYPKYYSIRDTAKYWKDFKESYVVNDLYLAEENFVTSNGLTSYNLVLTDTGSNRKILHRFILKNDKAYTISTMADGKSDDDDFKTKFFNSFSPLAVNEKYDNTTDKTDLYFKDFFSTDSAVYTLPRKSISSLYFNGEAAPKLYDAIKRMDIGMKDYFTIKTKLIEELGYIKDGNRDAIPTMIESIYNSTADTTIFQTEALFALARLKTKKSFSILQKIVLQDPPVFENSNDYQNLMDHLSDTLELSSNYVKDLMTLTTLDDYKEPVTNLLVKMVDSGYATAKTYKSFYKQLYVDARVALKKQIIKDEKQMQQDIQDLQNPEDVGKDNDEYDNNAYDNSYRLQDYAVLLMPFYDKEKDVQQFFSKLLQIENKNLLLAAATLMLKNKKPVPANVWARITVEEKYRGKLYGTLKEEKRLDLFPNEFKNQQEIAKSNLLAFSTFKKIAAVEYVGKDTTTYENELKTVYYFKYKVKSTDEWKIGISGLQPLNPNDMEENYRYISITQKRLIESEPIMKQFKEQLQKLDFQNSYSGKYFFNEENNYDYGY